MGEGSFPILSILAEPRGRRKAVVPDTQVERESEEQAGSGFDNPDLDYRPEARRPTHLSVAGPQMQPRNVVRTRRVVCITSRGKEFRPVRGERAVGQNEKTELRSADDRARTAIV